MSPDRPYVALLQDWLTVPTLSMFEKSLVFEMLKAAQESFEAFANRRTFIGQTFTAEILTAINKARAHGVGREWAQYA